MSVDLKERVIYPPDFIERVMAVTTYGVTPMDLALGERDAGDHLYDEYRSTEFSAEELQAMLDALDEGNLDALAPLREEVRRRLALKELHREWVEEVWPNAPRR